MNKTAYRVVYYMHVRVTEKGEFTMSGIFGKTNNTKSNGGKLMYTIDDMAAAVRRFLVEKELVFSDRRLSENAVLIELGVNYDSISLKVRIILENKPMCCRLDVVMPICADKLYAYPLCRLIVKENFDKRLGCIKYNESSGELLYQYAFLTSNGMNMDDFGHSLLATIGSSASVYNELRRFAVGKFKSSEISEIIETSDALIRDISEN